MKKTADQRELNTLLLMKEWWDFSFQGPFKPGKSAFRVENLRTAKIVNTKDGMCSGFFTLPVDAHALTALAPECI
jgi:hypothetical protein